MKSLVYNFIIAVSIISTTVSMAAGSTSAALDYLNTINDIEFKYSPSDIYLLEFTTDTDDACIQNIYNLARRDSNYIDLLSFLKKTIKIQAYYYPLIYSKNPTVATSMLATTDRLVRKLMPLLDKDHQHILTRYDAWYYIQEKLKNPSIGFKINDPRLERIQKFDIVSDHAAVLSKMEKNTAFKGYTDPFALTTSVSRKFDAFIKDNNTTDVMEKIYLTYNFMIDEMHFEGKYDINDTPDNITGFGQGANDLCREYERTGSCDGDCLSGLFLRTALLRKWGIDVKIAKVISMSDGTSSISHFTCILHLNDRYIELDNGLNLTESNHKSAMILTDEEAMIVNATYGDVDNKSMNERLLFVLNAIPDYYPFLARIKEYFPENVNELDPIFYNKIGDAIRSTANKILEDNATSQIAKSYAHIALACIDYSYKRYSDALSHAEAAVRLNPQSDKASVILKCIKLKTGHYRDAIDLCHRIAELESVENIASITADYLEAGWIKAVFLNDKKGFDNEITTIKKYASKYIRIDENYIDDLLNNKRIALKDTLLTFGTFNVKIPAFSIIRLNKKLEVTGIGLSKPSPVYFPKNEKGVIVYGIYNYDDSSLKIKNASVSEICLFKDTKITVGNTEHEFASSRGQISDVTFHANGTVHGGRICKDTIFHINGYPITLSGKINIGTYNILFHDNGMPESGTIPVAQKVIVFGKKVTLFAHSTDEMNVIFDDKGNVIYGYWGEDYSFTIANVPLVMKKDTYFNLSPKGYLQNCTTAAPATFYIQNTPVRFSGNLVFGSLGLVSGELADDTMLTIGGKTYRFGKGSALRMDYPGFVSGGTLVNAMTIPFDGTDQQIIGDVSFDVNTGKISECSLTKPHIITDQYFPRGIATEIVQPKNGSISTCRAFRVNRDNTITVNNKTIELKKGDLIEFNDDDTLHSILFSEKRPLFIGSYSYDIPAETTLYFGANGIIEQAALQNDLYATINGTKYVFTSRVIFHDNGCISKGFLKENMSITANNRYPITVKTLYSKDFFDIQFHKTGYIQSCFIAQPVNIPFTIVETENHLNNRLPSYTPPLTLSIINNEISLVSRNDTAYYDLVFHENGLIQSGCLSENTSVLIGKSSLKLNKNNTVTFKERGEIFSISGFSDFIVPYAGTDINVDHNFDLYFHPCGVLEGCSISNPFSIKIGTITYSFSKKSRDRSFLDIYFHPNGSINEGELYLSPSGTTFNRGDIITFDAKGKATFILKNATP